MPIGITDKVVCGNATLVHTSQIKQCRSTHLRKGNSNNRNIDKICETKFKARYEIMQFMYSLQRAGCNAEALRMVPILDKNLR